jgi:3-oxo-5alpha-steroid 4-dehydrogenase
MIRERSELGPPDQTFDVVIVGYGCAGACAAIESSPSCEVLLVEGAPIGGGTSAASHAIIYLGGGTPIQRACGFDDSPENMSRYLTASCGPEPDATLIEPYCEGSVEHFDWLVRQGVPFKPSYYDAGHFPDSDDGLVYSGNERVHPFAELASPAPRGHIPQTQGPAGGLLMRTLSATVARSLATVALGSRCEALVRERDGRVCGVILVRDGIERFISARRGVILTTGGFIWNDDMLREFAPDLLRCQHKVGTPSDDGYGIRLGMAAGAATIGLDRGDVLLPLYPPTGLKRGLLVNRDGRRFINEDAYHGRIGEFALHKCGGDVWMIIDSTMDERPQNTPAPIVAVENSIFELEAALGMPKGKLQETVRNYNVTAESGRDTEYHKAPDFVRPLATPPFAAFDLRMESAHYGGFTLGGLRIDSWGQVLDTAGEPVPGLLAAGRAASGIAKRGYSSGLSVGDASFFGRRAGRAASGQP